VARLVTNEPRTRLKENDMEPNKMMQIVAVVERGEGEEKKNWWTRIGVAFQNRDGSWNLRFDYLPARIAETTIQLRELEPKDDDRSQGKAKSK
jgi:hypothetical protein